MFNHHLKLAVFVALLPACDGSERIDTADTDAVTWGQVSHIDDGAVCFGDVATDTESTIYIEVDACMSSSCTDDFQGTCEATVEGSEITLNSDIRWDEVTGGNIGCTSDCGIPTASCTLEGLPDGTYTVRFGTQTLTLNVPSSEVCQTY